MAYVKWVDEFILTKGEAKYTGPFTPPATEGTLGGGVPGDGDRVYPGPFGNQNAYASYAASIVDISKGDFTLEGKWRIDNLYETLEGEPIPRYAIVGQYDDILWDASTGGEQGNWWALEYIDDAFHFRVWDANTASYIVDMVASFPIDWETTFTDHRAANTSPDYIYFALVRSGNNIRLLINGVVGATATVTDWSTITRPIEVGGQDGVLNPDIPYSITYVQELRFTDEALYWETFDPLTVDWLGGSNICFYPRVAVSTVIGYPGDASVSIPINIRMEGGVSNAHIPISFDASFPELTSEGNTIEGGSGDAIIPAIMGAGNTGLTTTGTFALLDGSGVASVEITVDLFSLFPPLGSIGYTVTVNEVNGNARFDNLTSTGLAYTVAIGDGSAYLPSLIGYGTGYINDGSLLLNVATLGICLNTEINAISTYTGFSFDSMCVFNDEVLGAGASGIFIHSGDTDNIEPVVAYFDLFDTDLGTTKQKRLRRIFVDGNLMGTLQVTSKFDTVTGTVYTLECPPTLTSMQVKIPADYDDYGQLIGLRVSNVNGSDFSIDNITATVVALTLAAVQYGIIGRIKVTLPEITGEATGE